MVKQRHLAAAEETARGAQSKLVFYPGGVRGQFRVSSSPPLTCLWTPYRLGVIWNRSGVGHHPLLLRFRYLVFVHVTEFTLNTTPLMSIVTVDVKYKGQTHKQNIIFPQ